MRKAAWVAALATVIGVGQVQAQGTLPLSLEIRGGFAIATGEWNEEEGFESGVGFTGRALFHVTPMISIYGGWERYEFGLEEDEEFPDLEGSVVDSGARLGAEISLPVAAPVAPFVFGGATYSTYSGSVSGGGISFGVESDRSLGFEVGAGVGIPLGQVVAFTPAVKYSSFTAGLSELEDLGEAIDTDVTVSRVTVDLGLRFRL